MATTRQYVSVALNLPLDTLFTYRVPPALADAIAVGQRVRVPFGRREMTGYCVEFPEKPPVEESRVKDVARLVDRHALLDAPLLELTRWMAGYYCCSWGEALEAVLPAGVRKKTAARQVMFISASRPSNELLARAEQCEARAPRQARVLRELAKMEGRVSATDLAQLAEVDHSVFAALAKSGYVKVHRESVAGDVSLEFRVHAEKPPDPTAEQRAALARIHAALERDAFHVALLHGVTGSGKTEVYLQALRKTVESGRQGIVLVPEIALTPQTVARFRARFERVCVLHSELSEALRRDQWQAIRAGKADVVIGARSAVFAPVPRLGLLVVDEEHEPSFKQQSAPRYHARDAGIWRAQREGALVLLGSATPSLESLHNARAGKYDLLELPRRVEGLPMPPVTVQDMNEEYLRSHVPLLSRRLRMAMENSLQKGEQVILFLNRRGYNTFLNCPKCGFVLRCEQCAVSMTFHRAEGVARCHYCDAQVAPPQTCPGCNAQGIKFKGTGTERIEEEVVKLFGAEAVVRMDSDSMRGLRKYEETLSDFRDGRKKILIGTQMIAKGLDFPNVTLVGVVNADVILNMPDFRAAERTFQLLAQVAGRAGRSALGGRVIVQTFTPGHPSIRHAARHDYAGFAREELESRRQHRYPPFARLARILVEGTDAKAVEKRCTDLVASVGRPPGVEVKGPAEAPIARIKGRARWHALVKARDSATLHAALAPLDRKEKKSLQVTLDVDPISLM